MSERTSAGELEQRYKIKHLLIDFTDEMKALMYHNIPDKGMSWRDKKICSMSYLKKKLLKAVADGDWVTVANYAFMIYDRTEISDGIRKEHE